MRSGFLSTGAVGPAQQSTERVTVSEIRPRAAPRFDKFQVLIDGVSHGQSGACTVVLRRFWQNDSRSGGLDFDGFAASCFHGLLEFTDGLAAALLILIPLHEVLS